MFFGIDLVEVIQAISYPGIFAIILAESGLFFAIYLPGGSMLFTAGLLASQGILNIWILLVTVIVAATLGDTIGYWFGAWVGPALYRRKNSRFLKQEHLQQTRIFFEEHGAKTVLLARFVPIVRTFAPILAGVGNMNYSTFLFYNVLGAVIWGGGFTLAGYFLGEAIPGIEHYLEYVVLGIVVVTMLPLAHHVWRARKMQQGAKTAATTPPQAAMFDLDDTLAESFQPPSDEILQKLFTLAGKMPVAIMSGATFARLERDIMERLPRDLRIPFYVFSDNGARGDAWIHGSWEKKYGFVLEADERENLSRAIAEAVEETDIFEGKEKDYRILDRGTSVSFVAFKDVAEKTKKSAWDPEFVKRPKLAEVLRGKVPGYDVLIAGKTTIDVVRKGVSKAYSVDWLSKELHIPTKDMLFVGDAFYEGGNDAAVIPTGIRTYATSGPEETERMIDEMLR